MKEGDLITTYFKGYYRLDRIEKRFVTEDLLRFDTHKGRLGEEYNPLFYFTQEFDSNGAPKKSKQKWCDSGFCRLASESINEEIKELDKKKKQLLKIKTLVSN